MKYRTKGSIKKTEITMLPVIFYFCLLRELHKETLEHVRENIMQ